MRVYIAGPYTGPPGPRTNTQRALAAAELYRRTGHVVFVPHAMFPAWEEQHPMTYEEIMDQCLAWIRSGAIDLVVRLAGQSPGADREVIAALESGVRVVPFDAQALKNMELLQAEKKPPA